MLHQIQHRRRQCAAVILRAKAGRGIREIDAPIGGDIHIIGVKDRAAVRGRLGQQGHLAAAVHRQQATIGVGDVKRATVVKFDPKRAAPGLRKNGDGPVLFDPQDFTIMGGDMYQPVRADIGILRPAAALKLDDLQCGQTVVDREITGVALILRCLPRDRGDGYGPEREVGKQGQQGDAQ